MDANDFFQGGYGDEASLIELVTLVGLEGLLARCGGLDGQLDQVAIFWISIYAINNQCRVALRQKFLTWTKILIRVLKVLLSKNSLYFFNSIHLRTHSNIKVLTIKAAMN